MPTFHQSRPKPRGGSTLWISDRSRSQIAQRFRRRACLKVLRQRTQPCPVIVLYGDELGHRRMPSLRPTAAVGGASVSDPGRPVGVRRAKAGLPLSCRHRLVAQWFRASFHGLYNPLRNEFIWRGSRSLCERDCRKRHVVGERARGSSQPSARPAGKPLSRL